MEIYRQELIETQKERSALFKWKLAIVSVLAAVGLGMMLPGQVPETRGILLCFIPLACVYVDMLHMGLGLRIHGIALFLRTHEAGPDAKHFKDYEELMHKVRADAANKLRWPLNHLGPQMIVLRSSTYIIVVCVFFYGLSSLWCPATVSDAVGGIGVSSGVVAWMIMGSSVISIVLYWLLVRDYRIRTRVMKEWKSQSPVSPTDRPKPSGADNQGARPS